MFGLVRSLGSKKSSAPIHWIPPKVLSLSRAPHLEMLDIDVAGSHNQVFDGAPFDGDLKFLRELRLDGVTTHSPRRNLTNLKTFDPASRPLGHCITQLLDFFHSVPFLRMVRLVDSFLELSNAPPNRTLPLRHLKVPELVIYLPPFILLNIPAFLPGHR